MTNITVESSNLLDFSCKKKIFDYFLDYLNEPTDLDAAAEFLIREFSPFLKSDKSLLALYNDKSGYYLIKKYSTNKCNFESSFDFENILFIDWPKYFIDNNLSYIEYDGYSDTLNLAEIDYLRLNNVDSFMIFPLKMKDEFLGLIIIQKAELKISYNDQQLNIINIMLKIISTIIKQTEFEIQTRNRVRRHELLFTITDKIRKTLDVDEIKKDIVNTVSRAFNIDRCFIRLFDTDNDSIDKEYLSSPDVKSIKYYSFSEEFDKFIKSQFETDRKLILYDTEQALKNPNFNDSYRKILIDMEVKSKYGFAIFNKDKLIGVFVAHYTIEKHILSNDDIELLSTISNQAGIAIAQAELYSKTRKNAEREFLIRKITETIRNSLDLEEIQQRLVTEVGKSFNADKCFIKPVSQEGKEFLLVPECAEYFSSPEFEKTYNLGEEEDGYAIEKYKKGKTFEIPDTEEFKNKSENLLECSICKSLIARYNVRANYSYPILHNNELLGVFILQYLKPTYLAKEENDLLKTVVGQAAIAIKQAQLYAKTKKQAETEEVFRNIITTIRNTLDISEMRKNISTEIGRAFGADRCAIHQFDAEKNKFLGIDKSSEYLLSPEEISLMGVDLEDKKNLFFKNLYVKKKELLAPKWNNYLDSLDKISNETKDSIKKFNIKSKYVFPITYGDNLLGVLYLIYSKKEKEFLNSEFELIRTLMNQVGIAFYQVKLYLKFRQNNIKEKFLRKMMSAIKQTENIDELLTEICKDTAAILNAQRILIIDYKRIINKPVLLKEFISEKSLVPFNFTDYTNLWNYIKKNTIDNKGKLVINNVETALMPDNVLKECQMLGIKSFISRPFRTEEHNRGCIIVFDHNSNREWSIFEINLLKQVSDYISMGLKEAALCSQSNFIANISHEIKTPLSILEGYSDALMKDDIIKSQEVKNYIIGIKNNINRINNIIETFLFISRLEKDYEQDKIQFYDYNLQEILEFAVNLCDKQAEQKNIKMRIICDDNIVVKANMLLLQQAVFNLIQNAIKHSENLNEIIVYGYQTDEEVIVKVLDNGCGIAKEQLNKIFDKFYRIDKSRSRATGGTGLGLSIVKLIAQVHKGYVYVESNIGMGSSFYIFLPKSSY